LKSVATPSSITKHTLPTIIILTIKRNSKKTQIMKRTITLVAAFIWHSLSIAQVNSAWKWAHVQTGAPVTNNAAFAQHAVAAHGHKALWCNILNAKELDIPHLGDYRFTEYDTSGIGGVSTIVTGKLGVLAALPDSAGNWYILARYRDSISFAGGKTMVQGMEGSEYCIFRLDAGTLSLAWAQPAGDNFFAAANCFDVANNTVYFPVDSAGITRVCKMDCNTGARTTLWTQTGQSWTTSIQADSRDNIYLVGTCAFNGIDFNGHTVTLPPLFQYPQYIVRYQANGTHDWSKFMQDGTCFTREFTVADDNTIYYTGPIDDTLTLGNILLHSPRGFGSFMAAQMDSTGNFNWARQLSQTSIGDAILTDHRHAASTSDGSLVIYAVVTDTIDWGNGVTSQMAPPDLFTSTVVAFSKSGTTLWATDIMATVVTPQQIAVAGNSVWVTGNAFDDTQLSFGGINISLPAVSFDHYPFIGRIGVSLVPTDIKDAEKEHLNVYPNPATEYITIEYPHAGQRDYTVRIRNIMGKLVLEQISGNNQRIHVSEFARGIYFLEVSDGRTSTVKKMVLR
jgi:hypothetical protein